MKGLARNPTVRRLSRRYNGGYEPLDGVMRSETPQDPPQRSMSIKRKKVASFPLRTAEDEAMRSETLQDPPPRSMSIKRKKVASFPLRTAKDEARQRRQLFINSYKFETADNSQRFVCCRKMNKVVSKVKTSVAKLVSSVSKAGACAFRSCNCRLAIEVLSPKPRSQWF